MDPVTMINHTNRNLKIIFVAWSNVAKMLILKRLIQSIQQEKMMDFDYREENNFYYDSVKKTNFSFSWHLRKDKKSIM